MGVNDSQVVESIARLQELLDARLGESLRKALREAGPYGTVVVRKVHDELVLEVKQSTTRRSHG